MALSKSQIWDIVHAERRKLADDLAGLTPEQWDTPSLCEGWSVHDALAHLIDTAHMGKRGFVASLVRARGNFNRANELGVRKFKHDDGAASVAELRAAQDLTYSPPAPTITRFIEAALHGEDIRRPLGMTGDYPIAAVHEALSYMLRTPDAVGGGKNRAAGLRLVDVETGRSWGTGEEVGGTALDLLVALSGRRVEPGRLTGPGAARLTGRNA